MSNRMNDPICRLIDTQSDYIHSKRHNDSLKVFLDQHPQGCDEATICRLLKIPKDKYPDIFSQLLEKLQTLVQSY